jgi:hypothetical protein
MRKSAKLFLILIMAAAAVASTADNKQSNKFKNFEYPFAGNQGWPHQLEWQNVDEPNKVKLVDGKWREPDSDSDMPFNGLTLESVTLADVTADGINEAIVVLRYDTGGTQYSHYVYIYSIGSMVPKLLAFFHSGDRAAAGLYRVYAEKGNLVVELYDPDKRQGDCCSDGFVRTRFHWTESAFGQVGGNEYGNTKSSSRLAVDTFGRRR